MGRLIKKKSYTIRAKGTADKSRSRFIKSLQFVHKGCSQNCYNLFIKSLQFCQPTICGRSITANGRSFLTATQL